MKRLIYCLLACCLVSSCGIMNSVTRESQYAKMYEEKPITMLVMPPINNTTNVEAKDLLYTSISRPLAEAGYYVFSPLLAMDILKAERSIKHVETEAMKRVRENREARQKERLRTLSKKLTTSDKPS